jgi:tetratricopeptide (TPR) repeat protein
MFSRILLSVTILGVATPAIADTTAASEESPIPARSGFVLSVDTGAPGSESLVNGNYDAAIKSAKRSARLSHQRSAYLTLCAAYIGKAALAEAREACDAAVDSAQTPITTARVPYGHRDREGLAKAYSNRAILKTLLGETEAARADIELAARQNRHLAVIEHNEEIIGASPRLARGE